jgi:hypothetical protein
MRKIQIVGWKAKGADGKDMDEDLLEVLDILLSNKNPAEFPKGLANFRLMDRISKAFQKAEVSKVLELEESDYAFLKSSIENDIPSMWAKNPNVVEAINTFLNAQEN